MLKELSKPSGGERNGGRKPHQRQQKRKRALRSPESIRKHIVTQAEHIKNALTSNGSLLTFEELSEFRHFLKGAVAVLQPFNADGSPRAEGDFDRFVKVADIFVRCCAVLLPFERPRLASMTFHDDRHDNEDDGPYKTVWEMRTILIKEGISVDHLDSPKMIEHRHAGADTDSDDTSSVY